VQWGLRAPVHLLGLAALLPVPMAWRAILYFAVVLARAFVRATWFRRLQQDCGKAARTSEPFARSRDRDASFDE
jgi:hypothetical protein